MTASDYPGFRYRQIHLDFHTSPAISGIGENFDKKEWQAALKLGHVDSITVFSKCHHGYSYHPSAVNEMHPGLKFDLLGAQLEACREAGVRAPVYISAGFDEKDAVAHPEWLCIGDDGAPVSGSFLEARFHLLCLNTPYLDKLLAEIDEVMRVYKPCEIFLDILAERTCFCAKCRADMEKLGYDYRSAADAAAFGKTVYKNYRDRVEETVRRYSADTAIFHNSGHLSLGRRDLISSMTHLELESLPTGGWGYDHFPLTASYARTLRENYLGMTGKFHRSWGEFGGFKHPNALRYEAALCLALGAGCSVGDQMHPDGRLNTSTFGLIGRAYEEVEKKEPWCRGAKAVTEIAVLGASAISDGRLDPADIGANRILLEKGCLYDFIDEEEDFGKYRLLILPDKWRLSGKTKEKIRQYVSQGGRLLLSGVSGLDENNDFAVDTGVKFLGENSFEPTYFIPRFETVNGVTEYLMRSKNYRVENVSAEVIGTAKNPYFNRDCYHFCSHQHAPNDDSAEFEAAFVKGGVAYIGWDIFSGYAMYGDLHIKELVFEAIKRLMSGSFIMETNLPDRAVQSLMRQGDRLIAHLLYAHTTLRGNNVEVIEDIVPLYNVNVSVKCERPSSVTLVPEGRPLDFTYENGRVCFSVPEVNLHAMAVIE